MSLSPLVRYEDEIMRRFNAGQSTLEIATHLYEHAVGPIDRNHREKDIDTIIDLLHRFLANPLAARRAYQAEQEQQQEHQASIAARKAKLALQRARQKAEREREEERIRELAESRRRHFEEECAKVPAWRDRNWEEVLPTWLAVQQHAWCRHMAARRMRQAGLTLEQIGYRFRVSKERARQMAQKAQRYENNPHGNKSPLERWLKHTVSFETRWQDYADPSDRRRARRALKVVEVWTGLATVPRCSAAEHRTWELYYAMRGDHEQESHHHHQRPRHGAAAAAGHDE